MSYTGPAYILGLPSDQFIGERLSGFSFTGTGRDPGRVAGMISGIGGPWRHIGPAMRFLEEALRAAFADRKMWPVQPMMFELLVSGWQWGRRKRPRPIVLTITKAAGSRKVSLLRRARHFGRDFLFLATPTGHLRESEINTVRASLRRAWHPDDAEAALVQTIRSVSSHSPYVGPSCVSVLIPPPFVAPVRIRFHAPETPRLAVTSTQSDEVIETLPAAFSPWIIGRGGTMSPSILSGTMPMHSAGFPLVLEGPRNEGGTIEFAMGSIPRPPEPR
jgi:hypothetical protein